MVLSAGQPAPYTGYLFPKDVAQTTRIRLIEGEEAKKLNESYARSIDLYQKNDGMNNQKVNILLEQNDKLSKELTSARGLTDWEKIGFFLAGVVLTGAAVYGASHLAK